MSSDKRFPCPKCGEKLPGDVICCPRCGAINAMAGWREAGKDECGNCHEKLEKDAKYCVYCGTKVGEGAYEPYRDLMECIYGPMPVDRVHACKSCGYEWTVALMIDKQRFCPRCGGGATTRLGKTKNVPLF